jgi:hypothetical protein
MGRAVDQKNARAQKPKIDLQIITIYSVKKTGEHSFASIKAASPFVRKRAADQWHARQGHLPCG